MVTNHVTLIYFDTPTYFFITNCNIDMYMLTLVKDNLGKCRPMHKAFHYKVNFIAMYDRYHNLV